MVFNLWEDCVKIGIGKEMDQNGGEMGTLNQNGQLPVGVTVWYTDVFCVSGHDTYKMSFVDVHVGGWAWIFNIPGGAIQSLGKTFHQLSSGRHLQ